MSNKFSSLWFKGIVSMILFAFTTTFVLPVNAAAAAFDEKKVTVVSGTAVVLETVKDITTKDVKVGDKVTLSVSNDVIVEGEVVIKKGTIALGEVVVSQKNGAVGAPGKLGISIRSVPAVDGTNIVLSGSKNVEGKSKQTESIVLTLLCCILFLIMKGDDASISKGTSIDTYVLSNAVVTVTK